MHAVKTVLVALVAVEHVYILILEMFLWTTPRGRKAFGLTPEFATASKALAANQGLYNGFLAAGLFWSLFPSTTTVSSGALQGFFLGCVIVAALFGAATAKRSILFVQGGPAILAMAALIADNVLGAR